MTPPFFGGAYLWITIHGSFCTHRRSVLAAYRDEGLAPISAMRTVMGYAVGNYAAFLAAWLCSLVA